jgi:hypothetical protein
MFHFSQEKFSLASSNPNGTLSCSTYPLIPVRSGHKYGVNVVGDSEPKATISWAGSVACHQTTTYLLVLKLRIG